MPCVRTPPGGRRALLAATATLLVAAGGCNIGGDRLACTLDPAALVASVQGPAGGCAVSVGGGAFNDGAACGVACPRPWTVTVRWTNRTTGASGAQPLTWTPGGPCWPFFGSSCALSGFALQVPVVAGANDLLVEADEGDGFTACQRLEATGPPGC